MVFQKENPLRVDCLAAETQQGADGASGLPSKLARYSEARHRALQMQSFAKRAGYVKESARLGSCGNYLVFRDYYTVDKLRLHAASFCKSHLLCPLCAMRRGSKMLDSYLRRYQAVQSGSPTLRPYFVTVTVKNGDDLGERVRHLRAGLASMFEARRNALKGQRFVEFARSRGGFHSIEVTHKGNGWHPHAHMIWLCEEAPDPQALSREWRDWTGDSFIVDVRPVTDPVEGFLEVCKYALKFSDLSLDDNFEAYKVLRCQRLVDCHGLFRGVEIPQELTDEPLDGLPYVELFYRYLPRVGYSVASVSEPRVSEPRPVKEGMTEAKRAALRADWKASRFYRFRLRSGPLRIIYSFWKPEFSLAKSSSLSVQDRGFDIVLNIDKTKKMLEQKPDFVIMEPLNR